MTMTDVRETIRYWGRVQGVGFRAATQRIARGFAVTGWVRNEPDGTVLCVAEGAAEELQRFRAQVQQAMAGYIQRVEISQAPALSAFAGFTVEH